MLGRVLDAISQVRSLTAYLGFAIASLQSLCTPPLTQASGQLLGADRLSEKVVHADSEAMLTVFSRCRSGERNNWNLGSMTDQIADDSGGLKSVHAGHDAIHEYE